MTGPHTAPKIFEAFDHSSDPALRARHFGEWDRLREVEGSFGSSLNPDRTVWFLLRYADIHTALQDYELFSSSSVIPFTDEAHHWIPEEIDPPEHNKYRRILNPAFSPQVVAGMEGAIRVACADLIDGLTGAAGCDVIADFSRQFPTRIFMRIMGLPVERADELLEMVHNLMHTNPTDDPDGAIRGGAMMAIYGLLTEIFHSRRAAPHDDLMTTLVQAEVDGRPLSDDELRETGFLLYMAGLDTVAGAIGYVIKHLAENPDQQRAVRERPASIPAVVEEALRMYSIVTTSRVVTRDVEFAGCPMKAGDRIVVPTASANRDPAAFEDATTFDADRTVNRHIAFGAGPHRCLGSHLARAELRIALEEWHARVPRYRLDPDATITEHIGGVAGLDSLRVTWG